jgi:hypothetical protein
MAVALYQNVRRKEKKIMDTAKKRSLVAAIIFATFVSTIFAGCYHDRDDDWGYHRYSRDYSYDRDRYDRDRDYDRDAYYDHDRDWRSDRYDRSNDYRDRDDSYRSSRIDPLRNHYND